jgi:hypothetical protein
VLTLLDLRSYLGNVRPRRLLHFVHLLHPQEGVRQPEGLQVSVHLGEPVHHESSLLLLREGQRKALDAPIFAAVPLQPQLQIHSVCLYELEALLAHRLCLVVLVLWVFVPQLDGGDELLAVLGDEHPHVDLVDIKDTYVVWKYVKKTVLEMGFMGIHT